MIKYKKCKVCKNKFSYVNSTQIVCSMNCAIDRVKLENKKKYDNRTKVMKEKIKTRSEHLKELQVIFNKFIRIRDEKQPCISCGCLTSPQWAAGHYRSVGACPELRFNEDNVHKQCNKYCNNELSGNIINYRKGLIKKIGLERLEIIEGYTEPKKYTIERIKEMKKIYKNKIKVINNG